MPMGKIYKYKKGYTKRGGKPKKQAGYKMTKRVPRNRISLNSDYTSFFRCNPIEISNDSTVETKIAFAFRLSDIINFSSWTTLFDQYRIDKVVVKFVPVQTEAVFRPYDDTTNPGASVSEIPRLCTIIDRDDESSPIDFNQIFQRPQSRTRKATQTITWTFVPNRLVEVYRSATTTGYKVDTNKKEFLDCGYSDVPHYGMKAVLQPTSPANCYQYRIERTYQISLKNRRI